MEHGRMEDKEESVALAEIPMKHIYIDRYIDKYE